MSEINYVRWELPKRTMRDKLNLAFHSWVMRDPYPEMSDWERREHMFSSKPFRRLFGRSYPNPKPEINVHKAWQDGYYFAKELAMKACGDE